MSLASTPARLVIGYGSDLRGDDAAGRAAAEMLATLHPVDTLALSVHQLTPELAPMLAQARVAIFLDASADTISEVSIARITPGLFPLNSGHFADPASLLLLARAIYGREPQAWLVTIPASDFTLGAPLSLPTRTAVADAVAMVCRMLEQLPEIPA